MKRSKIAYFCMAAFGHVDWGGVIETLQALRDRGHEVYVASGPSLEDHILARGLQFIDIGLKKIEPVSKKESIPQAVAKHQRQNFFNVSDVRDGFSRAKKAFPGGLDIILADSFCLIGRLMSSYLDIPRVTFDPQIPPALIPNEMAEIMANASKKYKEKLEDFLNQESLEGISLELIAPSDCLNVTFSTPKFDGDIYNPASTYVGADPLKRKRGVGLPLHYPHGKKVFYSPGTLFWTREQTETILRLAKENPINLFIGGARILPKLQKAQNIIPLPFADDDELFPHMDAIITQGGLGTATKTVRAGKPPIVIPLIFANYAFAMKTNRYGNGIGILPEEFNYAQLENALNRTLYDEAFDQSASRLKQEFEEEGGSRKAADLIEGILR